MKDEKSGVFKFRFNALSGTAETKADRKRVLRRLKKSLSPYKGRLWLFGFITLLYSITYVVFPRLLGSILDLFSGEVVAYMLGFGDGSVFRKMIPYGVFALCIFILNSLFAFIQGHIISDVITSYAMSLRKAVTGKFNILSVRYIDSSDHKELLMKMTGDIDALDQSLNIIFMRYASSAFVFVSVIVMQFILSPVLGLISLGFCIIMALLAALSSKRAKKSAARERASTFGLFDDVSEFYSGLSPIQLSGKLRETVDELVKENRQAMEITEKSRFSAALQNSRGELFSALCLSAVAVFGAFCIKAESITVGILQCQLIYVRRLFSSFSEFSTAPGVIRTLISSADSLFSFFDISDTENSNEKESVPDSSAESLIEFSDVSFRYSSEGKQILENVSFSVPERGITSLSGITGAGKTTMIKLMLGFYRPDSGRVLYKGKDVHLLPVDRYLARYNIIIQGATLFNDTVYNNIAYGNGNVTREQVMQASALAGLTEAVERLPEGYDTVFDTEEPNLSQGEIQLVLLARAFLRRSEIVVFDEATSGIDIVAEKKINKALELLAESSAVIVIAHRSSATAGAIRKISLSDGRVKEKTT